MFVKTTLTNTRGSKYLGGMSQPEKEILRPKRMTNSSNSIVIKSTGSFGVGSCSYLIEYLKLNGRLKFSIGWSESKNTCTRR